MFGARRSLTKPIGLQEALIKAVTSPRDVVVDPAGGSFSVLKACARTGRNFLGCDISPKFLSDLPET